MGPWLEYRIGRYVGFSFFFLSSYITRTYVCDQLVMIMGLHRIYLKLRSAHYCSRTGAREAMAM